VLLTKPLSLSLGEELQFRLDLSLTSRNIEVKCNYPAKRFSFKRDKYHKLEWKCKHDNQYDPDRYAKIHIQKPGSFHFNFHDADNHDGYVYCVCIYVGVDFYSNFFQIMFGIWVFCC